MTQVPQNQCEPFLTTLLDARLARQRAQSEQERQAILRQALAWLQVNASAYSINTGYLFGSVTQPYRFGPRSDVDLAVENWGGDPFGLSSYLSLHLDRDVDVVPLHQCHFAEKVRQTGILWIVKTLPD